jgi:hypothetical protein
MSRWNAVILPTALATICAAPEQAGRFETRPWQIWAPSPPRLRLHGSFEDVIFSSLALHLAVLF